eukprot:1893946-Rhodomonas_salina.2
MQRRIPWYPHTRPQYKTIRSTINYASTAHSPAPYTSSVLRTPQHKALRQYLPYLTRAAPNRRGLLADKAGRWVGARCSRDAVATVQRSLRGHVTRGSSHPPRGAQRTLVGVRAFGARIGLPP